MGKKVEKCYMCEREESSREHVPPRCLFPQKKDIGHSKYRKNLITVPSCYLHNSTKSKDDEFLMVSIAGVVGNNSIGYSHYTGKVSRAIRRSSFRLLSNVFSKRKKIKLNIKNNRFIDVIVGAPDLNRLLSCFEHIAYGIYRHQFGEKFIGEIKVTLGFLTSSEETPENFKEFIKHKFKSELAHKPLLGENPSIFHYQFTDIDKNGIFGLKMCFYNNVDVYVAYQPKGIKKPFHLGMALMNDGVKTIFKIEDREYEVN